MGAPSLPAVPPVALASLGILEDIGEVVVACPHKLDCWWAVRGSTVSTTKKGHGLGALKLRLFCTLHSLWLLNKAVCSGSVTKAIRSAQQKLRVLAAALVEYCGKPSLPECQLTPRTPHCHQRAKLPGTEQRINASIRTIYRCLKRQLTNTGPTDQ